MTEKEKREREWKEDMPINEVWPRQTQAYVLRRNMPIREYFFVEKLEALNLSCHLRLQATKPFLITLYHCFKAKKCFE